MRSWLPVLLLAHERSPSWPWVILLPLVLLSALGVFMFYKYKWMKHSADCQELMVDASQGDKAVLLPFKTTEDFPHDVTVEWKLTEPKHMRVHVYQNSQSQPERDQVYEGRTKMNEEPLRNKDLSLKLKDPRLTDSGVYTCTITSKNGNILLRKVVSLTVRESQMEMVEVKKWEESVLLPFKTRADLPQDVTVEWKRSDLKPTNVFRYQSNRHLVDEQDQVYRGRTEMNEEPLKTGDLSLKLKQPRITDSGIYTCTVYKNEAEILKKKVVVLSVKVYQFQMIEVTQGEKHVLLPFITTADLLEDVTVEWKRSDVKHMKIHVYPNSQNMPDEQDQNYQGRTEMNEEPLRTGDLSLKLTDPRITDSGVYTCTAYNKDGDILRQKVVILSVRVYQVEMVKVTQGNTSVLLPFKTTADFPNDVTVEWRCADCKVLVYTYQNIQNQLEEQGQDYRGRTDMSEEPLRTGDLSLTLKKPRLTDSGVYTCTIYNKDGDIVRQKVVPLSVRVYREVELVEVTKGKKSVLLPFKTTADLPVDVTVEWRRADTKDIVHMYQNGQNQLEEQGQDYRGRTEMSEEPLRTGDLSLTLKKPQHNHSGFYTCTVFKGEDILRQKRLTLTVRERHSASFAGHLQVFRKKRTITNGLPPPENNEADRLMEQSV
ncbi:butyrophilin-like protein 2 isoform X2 [Archocentrus centrarchus]|uniref:butyrophilin-like protein 2 isoform X2 n=1 Tax=Archocentrus centrarchus TaxID=63155 RepID=UPI0011EA1216|nr:butyrophilin-like protein 2 isoform X2 [Archocentrus centrarchus]